MLGCSGYADVSGVCVCVCVVYGLHACVCAHFCVDTSPGEGGGSGGCRKYS